MPSSRADESSGTRVWLHLMKAHRSLGRHAARSIERFELGLSEFATLEMLLHKGPQPVNEIGRRIQLTSGAITSAVDRLEERQLVERRSAEGDRRTRLVALTSAGRRLISRVFSQHEAAMNQSAAGLSQAERKELIRLLKKLGLAADAGWVADPGPAAQ